MQKEVIQQLFNAKKNASKSKIPTDLITDDKSKKKTSSGTAEKGASSTATPQTEKKNATV